MSTSGTIWIPHKPPRERIWLLEDGTTLEEPDLEVTTGHRRVRLPGNQETSSYYKDLDKLIESYIDDEVDDGASEILTCLTPDAVFDAPAPLPEVSTLLPNDPSLSHARLRSLACKWRFRHASLPLTATVSLSLSWTYRGYTVQATFSFTGIGPSSRHYPSQGTCSNESWSVPQGSNWEATDELSKAPLTKLFNANIALPDERSAIREFKRRLDELDALAAVEIPDVRQQLTWIRLPFYDSNVTGALREDLNDYLNSEATITEVLKAYRELRSKLRYLGINIPHKAEGDFHRALIAKTNEALMVPLAPVDKEDSSLAQHTVFLHLATGAITVACDKHAPTEPEGWKLAYFEADMQGELDAFLNYHRQRTIDRAQLSIIDLARERTNPA